MRHRIFGRKLNRDTSHRKALLANMSTSLFMKERIKTTLPKAKVLRPFAERLITLAKREDLHARRQVSRIIKDKEAVKKLFDQISARYAQRPGGYTRIIKLGIRKGDASEMAYIELVDSEMVAKKLERDAEKSEKRKQRKEERMREEGERRAEMEEMREEEAGEDEVREEKKGEEDVEVEEDQEGKPAKKKGIFSRLFGKEGKQEGEEIEEHTDGKDEKKED